MGKLIIQIPCFDEEQTLPVTLKALPRSFGPGLGLDPVSEIEWLVIDDGSSDRTAEVALANGADHIVRLPGHAGLSAAFRAGIQACLDRGADWIVNTDADNQYCADDIPKLLAPILTGEAQIVVGARPISGINHFSPLKKALQRMGSWVVRRASRVDVEDAPSGFRAFSREAALRLNVFDPYTYTLETLIQAGSKGIPTLSVPVRVNAELRPSRLMTSMRSYVRRSIFTILRIFMTYRPMRFFVTLGSVPFVLGVGIGLRWIYLSLMQIGGQHIPSLILAAILILLGVQLFVLGLLADLMATNRQLLEDIQTRIRRAESQPGHEREQ